MIEVSTWELRSALVLEAFQWTGQIRTNQEFDQFPIWLNSRSHQMHITAGYLHFASRGRTMIAHPNDWIIKAPGGPVLLPTEVFEAWVNAWVAPEKAANMFDPKAAVETHVIRGGGEIST